VIRVALDVSPLVQTRAGTARYLKALLRELQRRDDVDVTTLSFGRDTRLSTLARDAVWYPFALGRRRNAELLHCPTYRGPVRSALPLVVTVHDLAVLRHPRAFNRWSRLYGPRVVPRVLAAARRVIAVSEFTKRELIELLQVPEDKIRVVPNGVDGTFTPDGPAEGGEYVLAVGTLEPRKNLPRLVEAMRRGAPVVTSRGTAMEEIADGAAVLVDPNDPAELAAGIDRATAERDVLVARGLERASAFRWGAVAEATVAVYREAVA
jgi:glycosyltransferase involved in cell wall biosynthesis